MHVEENQFASNKFPNRKIPNRKIPNRKIAWAITAFVMLAGFIIGSHTTHNQLRGPAIALFHGEMEPVVRGKMQLMYNILTLYELDGGTAHTDRVQIAKQSLEIMQRSLDGGNLSGSDLAAIQWDTRVLLAHASYFAVHAEDIPRIRSLHSDMRELTLILSQQSYNRVAEEFNNTISSGMSLRFLTNNWTRLPLFYY